MAQHNFEGDIDGVSERQLEFIREVILKLGFQNVKILIKNLGIAGDNYVANVKRIIIEEEQGSLSIIAKIAPNNETVRQLMNVPLLFKNEHLMYTEVLPKSVQLQKAEHIPETELVRYAKFYGSLSEAPNEIILLEDLKLSNFTMLDRFGSLSDECVRSVLKSFALLHSMSYVLKHKDPESFTNIKDTLTDLWAILAQTEEMKFYFKTFEDDTIAILNDVEYTDLLKNKITGALEGYMKISKADKNYKYSIIQQGAAWTNNFMFKFPGDQLPESVIIDYQLSKTTTPVADVMYMIFNCTDYETRKDNFYSWIDFYHSELEKSLSNYGLKVNFEYPRDQLDADLKRYGKVMLAFVVFLASLVIRKSDDAAKIMETMKNETVTTDFSEQAPALQVSELGEDSITRYRNRIVGLIHSLKDFGLF